MTMATVRTLPGILSPSPPSVRPPGCTKSAPQGALCLARGRTCHSDREPLFSLLDQEPWQVRVAPASFTLGELGRGGPRFWV